jgi:hypothetical protein
VNSVTRCWLRYGLLVLALAQARAGEFFFGEIPVQYVASGEEILLDMHRFLHPPAATVIPQAANAWFDQGLFTLHIAPGGEPIQPIRISATFDGKRIERVLIVAKAPEPKTHFSFTPSKPAERVTIAGEFNNWDRNATAMKGPDRSGDYEVELPLKPGRHAYKFAVAYFFLLLERSIGQLAIGIRHRQTTTWPLQFRRCHSFSSARNTRSRSS